MSNHILPLQPPDPQAAVETCRQYLARCRDRLAQAQTPDDAIEALQWIGSAQQQIQYWQAQLDRQVAR